MKKSSIFAILLILIMTVSLCGFTSCSKNAGDDEPDNSAPPAAAESEDEDDTEDSDFDHPEYANEQEDAVVKEKKSSKESFYGSWTAKSERAEYLYGNIDLTIHENGTWDGNVTEENWNGTWKYNGTGITLSSDIINCDLFYASDGVMMFRDHDDPEDLIALFPVGK